MKLAAAVILFALFCLISLGLQLPMAEPIKASEGMAHALPAEVHSESFVVGANIGVQMSGLRSTRGLHEARASGARWARILVAWKSIESVEGVYDWSRFDNRMAESRDSDISVIATIVSLPEWASETEAGRAVRVNPAKYHAFRSFLRELAQRSLDKGYNIRYYEILNEPENMDPAYADHVSCAYGRHPAMYADLLKEARQAIVSVDPEAKVAFGGLAMEQVGGRFSQEFPQQVLEVIQSRGSNGSEYFDAMNIHLYPYYYITRWSAPQYGSLPGLLGKINHTKQLMRRHGIDKPVLVTETSMFLGSSKPDVHQQSAYAVRVFVEGVAAQSPAVVWFTLSDNEGIPWEPSGLVDRNWIPRPAYWATRYLAGALEGATYLGRTPGLEVVSGKAVGFSFSRGGRVFHVLWGEWHDYTRADGPVGGNAVVSLPGNYARVVNMYGGGAQTGIGSNGRVRLNLDYRPVYVELYQSPPPTPTPISWQPTSVVVSASATAVLEGNGGLFEAFVPNGAFTGEDLPVTLYFGPSGGELQTAANASRMALPAFRFEAVNARGTPVTDLLSPLRMKMRYPDEAMSGLIEPTAHFRRLSTSESGWTLSGLSNQRVDVFGNEAQADMTILGQFGVFAEEDYPLYLPLVTRR